MSEYDRLKAQKDAILRRQSATQATSTAAQVPKDYVLVPLEPTEEMLKAGKDAWTEVEVTIGNGQLIKVPGMRVSTWSIFKAMIAAAPPQGESSEGWMPIETAPKDGTEIIVFHPAAGVCAAFCPQEGFAWHCMDGQNRFINNLGVSIPRMTSFIEPPTLWQPLPPPPSQKKATQEGDA